MDPLVQFCIMASLYLHLFNAEFLTEGVGILLKSKNTRLKATCYPPQSHRVSPSPASGCGHGYSCRDALTTGPTWAAAGWGGTPTRRLTCLSPYESDTFRECE